MPTCSRASGDSYETYIVSSYAPPLSNIHIIPPAQFIHSCISNYGHVWLNLPHWSCTFCNDIIIFLFFSVYLINWKHSTHNTYMHRTVFLSLRQSQISCVWHFGNFYFKCNCNSGQFPTISCTHQSIRVRDMLICDLYCDPVGLLCSDVCSLSQWNSPVSCWTSL